MGIDNPGTDSIGSGVEDPNANSVGDGIDSFSSGPNSPINLQSVGGNLNVYLSWSASAGATNYDVQGSSNGLTWTTISAAQSGLNYTDSSAAARSANGFAYYQVRANNSKGSSSYIGTGAVSPFMLYNSGIGADGTLITAYAGELNQVGNPWVMVSDGAIQITSNKFVTKTNAIGGALLADKETGQQDITVSGLFQLGDGPTLRIKDLSNRYFFGVQSNRFSIFEVIAGSAVEKDFCTGLFSAGNDYLVSASAIGNLLTATIAGGSKSLSYTISGSFAGSLTSTLHGFELHNSGAASNIFISTGSLLPGLLTNLPGDNGTAATWSDATTNANNATQATGANQMLPVAGVLNGHKIMRGNALSGMNLPNIQPVNQQFTQVALIKPSTLTAPNVIMAGAFTNNGASLFWMNSSAFPEADVYESSAVTRETQSDVALSTSAFNLVIYNAWYDNPASLSTVSPATQAQHVYINNGLGGISQFPIVNPISSPEITIGNISGTLVDGFTGDMAHMILATSNSGPSAADINRLTAYINTTYGLNNSLFTKQNIYIGDSITHGYQATSPFSGGTGSWASLIAKNDRTRWHINKGQPSIGLQGSSSIVTEISSQFATIVACGVPTTAIIFAGTNDIALYSATGAQVYAGYQSICTTLRAMGVNKIIVVSMLPRGATVETQRQILNNALRADHSFADGLADVETLAMGAAGANTNTTWYNADGTHPNDFGHGTSNLARLIGGVIMAVGG